MRGPRRWSAGRDQRDAALALVERLAVALEQHEHAVADGVLVISGHENTAR